LGRLVWWLIGALRKWLNKLYEINFFIFVGYHSDQTNLADAQEQRFWRE
jgi:hypothetical protein